MHFVYEDHVCRITAAHPPSAAHRRLLLSFTGVGHAMGGLEVQKPEFFGAGRDFDNVVFISDLTRSWGNALDFDQICAVLAPYVDGCELSAIGNSMGGFLCVLASTVFSIKVSLSFVPQFSVDPRVLPREHRWRDYRDAITAFRYPSLEGQFNAETQYYLLFGSDKFDVRHWERLPKAPNIETIILQGFDHGLANGLKRADLLVPVTTACMQAVSPRPLLEAALPGRVMEP